MRPTENVNPNTTRLDRFRTNGSIKSGPSGLGYFPSGSPGTVSALALISLLSSTGFLTQDGITPKTMKPTAAEFVVFGLKGSDRHKNLDQVTTHQVTTHQVTTLWQQVDYFARG